MSLQHAQTVVLWNPSAGTSASAAHLRDRIAVDQRLQLVETSSRDEAQQAIRDAAGRGCRRIIVAGGDGTVGAAVDALTSENRDLELAVLPLGTGNDLARSLAMPLDPDAALDVCIAGAAAPMDVLHAEVSEGRRYVANMVTAGNSGRYTHLLTDEQKQAWGPFCYLRGVLDVLQDLTVYDIACSFDDQPAEQFRVLNLFLANGRTSGGGVTVAPEASLDDGLLDCILILDGTPLELASLTADYVMTSFLNNELVVWRRCRSVRISAVQSLPFSADGDVLGDAPATFTVQPGALRVVRGPAPAASA